MDAEGRAAIGGLIALSMIVGCVAPDLTWIDVKVDYGSDVTVDQFRFEVLDGAASLVTALRPEQPRAPLPSEQGLAILLANTLASRRLTIRVTGLSSGSERDRKSVV